MLSKYGQTPSVPLKAPPVSSPIPPTASQGGCRNLEVEVWPHPSHPHPPSPSHPPLPSCPPPHPSPPSHPPLPSAPPTQPSLAPPAPHTPLTSHPAPEPPSVQGGEQPQSGGLHDAPGMCYCCFDNNC